MAPPWKRVRGPARLRIGAPGARAALLVMLLLGAQAAGAQTGVHVAFPPDRHVARAMLMEVTGHVGEATRASYDLIVALDLSDSTLLECGIDLDGDGPGGRTNASLLDELGADAPVLLRSRLAKGLDFDDTVLASQLEAARALIDRLDLERFRVGLVLFSHGAALVTPLGTDRKTLLATLDRVPLALAPFLRGTNLFDAIQVATAELAPVDVEPDPTRNLILVLLTDGEPTLPIKPDAESATLLGAALAAEAGVRIFAFPIGPKAVGAIDLLQTVGNQTRGAVVPIAHPGDVAPELRRLDLVDLASVEIHNATTHEPGRAVRFSPDGSFEGFVTLVPGPNRIVIRALEKDGRELVAIRSVDLGPERDDTIGRRRLEALRARTLEMEMWAEIEASRRRQRKEVEIVPDRTPQEEMAP